MNDYGFMTYDESGKKIQGSVNSKWPIFGPKYGNIRNAFRTVHFTDLTQYDFRTSSSVVLPGELEMGISEYHAYEKVLVAAIPHEYKKRPVGYATIAGTFVKNTRGKWAYKREVDYYSDFPPSDTLYGVGPISGNMQNSAGTMIRATNSSGTMSTFNINAFTDANITYPTSQYEAVFRWLTLNTFSIPGNNSSTADYVGYYRAPYAIEIDDENVYLYRYYYWCDVYKRHFYRDSTRVVRDLRARMQGVIDYAGSDFDLTIYLCPYNMEDLI